MDAELYYQAAISKTKFSSDEPDPESIGLDDFHKPEEEAVLDFAGSKDEILVMGGLSGVGKTHTLVESAVRAGFDFLDLHLSGRHINAVGELGANRAVQLILNDRRVESKNPQVFVMDEGLSGILNRESASPKNGIDGIIRELLKIYPRIVIAGGGDGFTGQEQTEMIAKALPKDLKISTHTFPTRSLNTLQTIDLVQRAPYGIFQFGKKDDPEKMLPREVSETIAKIIIQYFRMFRPIIKITLGLIRNSHESEIIDNLMLGNNCYPPDVLKRAWETQRELIRTGRERINAQLPPSDD